MKVRCPVFFPSKLSSVSLLVIFSLTLTTRKLWTWGLSGLFPPPFPRGTFNKFKWSCDRVTDIRDIEDEDEEDDYSEEEGTPSREGTQCK